MVQYEGQRNSSECSLLDQDDSRLAFATVSSSGGGFLTIQYNTISFTQKKCLLLLLSGLGSGLTQTIWNKGIRLRELESKEKEKDGTITIPSLHTFFSFIKPCTLTQKQGKATTHQKYSVVRLRWEEKKKEYDILFLRMIISQRGSRKRLLY